MNLRILVRTLSAAAITVGLSACGSDSTAPADVSIQQELLDIASSVGDAVGEDVALMTAGEASMSSLGAAAAFVRGSHVAASWSFPNNCAFDETSGRFTCPPVSGDGLTITRSYQLLDAQGAPQSAYDAHATASANFSSMLTGTASRDGWEATVERQRSLEVTGLIGTETQRTWNGTGVGAVGATYTGGSVSRAYAMSWTNAMRDVVVQLPRDEHPWPLSGTVSHSVTATRTRVGTRNVSRTVSVDAIVTFNGTRQVPLQVGSRQFTLDLVSRRVIAVN